MSENKEKLGGEVKRGRGRPKKEDPKNESLNFKVNRKERAMLEEMTKMTGKTMSEVIPSSVKRSYKEEKQKEELHKRKRLEELGKLISESIENTGEVPPEIWNELLKLRSKKED